MQLVSGSERIIAHANCDPVQGTVRWAPIKSLWIGSMTTAAMVLGPVYFSWTALLFFLVSSGITLCAGHSVGMHRRLIHNSFECPLWLEYLCVYLGVAAKDHFAESLRMAESSGDRPLQGQVLGYLGLVQARLGEAEEGRRLLELGKSTLQDLRDDFNVAMLLCNSAEAYVLVGEPELAHADLVAAQRLAVAVDGTAVLELSQALKKVETLLDHTPSGVPS